MCVCMCVPLLDRRCKGNRMARPWYTNIVYRPMKRAMFDYIHLSRFNVVCTLATLKAAVLPGMSPPTHCLYSRYRTDTHIRLYTYAYARLHAHKHTHTRTHTHTNTHATCAQEASPPSAQAAPWIDLNSCSSSNSSSLCVISNPLLSPASSA